MADIRTQKDSSDNRYYVDPATKLVYPGVTSIIDMAPKPWLGTWKAKLAAERAIDNIDLLAGIVERIGRSAAVKLLSSAADEYRDTRSALGTEAHVIFDDMLNGLPVARQRSDLEPYRINFAEFLAVVQPEPVATENLAWSDTHRYAGRFDVDMIVRLSRVGDKLVLDLAGGVPTLVKGDWKTSKSAQPSVALQLAAYENADYYVHPDGTRYDVPKFGASAVLHITDKKWEFRPVNTGPEVFVTFLALRTLFDWDRELSREVLGRPIAKGGA